MEIASASFSPAGKPFTGPCLSPPECPPMQFPLYSPPSPPPHPNKLGHRGVGRLLLYLVNVSTHPDTTPSGPKTIKFRLLPKEGLIVKVLCPIHKLWEGKLRQQETGGRLISLGGWTSGAGADRQRKEERPPPK